MIIVVLFVLSALISLVSLFYSISTGFFMHQKHETKTYSHEQEELVRSLKEEIVQKYIGKVNIESVVGKKAHVKVPAQEP